MKITRKIFAILDQYFSGMSVCSDAFETLIFLVFLRISFYCTGVKENILSGWILLLIVILGWCLYLFIVFNTRLSVFWKFILQLWSVGIFKSLTISTKKSLNISATFSSSDIISSKGFVELFLLFFQSELILI